MESGQRRQGWFLGAQVGWALGEEGLLYGEDGELRF